MVNVHFPHTTPLVVRENELRVRVRFPANPEIRVRKGEHVAADKVIATCDPTKVATRVPIAAQLDVAPADAVKCLTHPIGTPIAAGGTLAKHRRGLRNLAAVSPVAGTLVGFEAETGTALIAPAGAGEIRAMIPGEVEAIQAKTEVVIRTVGARIAGIVGLGAPVAGPIRFGVDAPDESLTEERINSNFAGAIVVGGRTAAAPAIRRLIEVGAAGLIVGGFNEREVATAFGWEGGDRLAPWRQHPDRPVIGAGLPIPIALVATEGFGAVPMNRPTFDLLAELRERQAALRPGTSLLDPVIRPELIVAEADANDRDAPISALGCFPGTIARLSDLANLAQDVVVASEPRYEHPGEGLTELVVDVELPDGSRRTVRAANLEILT